MSTVSGYVFVDTNGNQVKDGDEACYEGRVNIWVDGENKGVFQSNPGCPTYSFPIRKGRIHSIYIYPIPEGYSGLTWSGESDGEPCSGTGQAYFYESEINLGLRPATAVVAPEKPFSFLSRLSSFLRERFRFFLRILKK